MYGVWGHTPRNTIVRYRPRRGNAVLQRKLYARVSSVPSSIPPNSVPPSVPSPSVPVPRNVPSHHSDGGRIGRAGRARIAHFSI